MVNKYKGTDFDDYIVQSLKDDDQAVFLHIREALENPHIDGTRDYQYLIEAINDVVSARGKGKVAKQANITRQGLHKILNGSSVPSIQNIMAILNAIGLRFSIQQIEKVVSDDEPACVLDVAQYAAGLLPRGSTFMKLQKIVYYAQVEALVHYKKLLFAEKIEAWRAGPVVRKLWEVHKGYKFISQQAFGNSSNLSLEQRVCIDWAIEKYGKLEGDTLSHLTHLEEPWKNARRGLNMDDKCDREISTDSIIDYYSNLPNYSELEEQDTLL
jgi:uncharacterized phage-associated protein/DNA-binding phage protein